MYAPYHPVLVPQIRSKSSQGFTLSFDSLFRSLLTLSMMLRRMYNEDNPLTPPPSVVGSAKRLLEEDSWRTQGKHAQSNILQCFGGPSSLQSLCQSLFLRHYDVFCGSNLGKLETATSGSAW